MYYNTRLQPCRISVKSSGSTPTSCTDSANIGNILDYTYNFSLGTSNNGNVTGITNNVDTTRSQQFTYDHLNRILTAETTSTYATSPTHCWGESYTYDQWGNLTAIGVASTSYNSCTQESLSVTALSNNQLSAAGYSYDASGNMLTDGRNTYTWNSEDQLKTAAGVTYTYDGDGYRVEKSSGKLYWYGTVSDALMETDLSGNLTDEYIFFGGKRIARRDSSNNVVYYASDHLGTSRVVASSAGAILDQSDFYPFGGERVLSASSGNTYKFTGKERDSESNLDNFGARYDSSILGRFISVDPSRLSITLGNPQSWNRYIYALNNPVAYADRNGLWPTYIHDEIIEAVFGGILTRHQVAILENVSADQDAILKGGQKPENSNWHAQCAPGQSMTACATGIANHITTNLAKAGAVWDVQGLSDSALTFFGIAGHTLTDMGSPSHAAPDGTPTTWNGIFGKGSFGHFMGESDEAKDWYGIGQSVRNLIAGFVQAFPEEASKLGNADQAAQRAIESIVDQYYGLTFSSYPSDFKQDMARQCALGNRAACD